MQYYYQKFNMKGWNVSLKKMMIGHFKFFQIINSSQFFWYSQRGIPLFYFKKKKEKKKENLSKQEAEEEEE